MSAQIIQFPTEGRRDAKAQRGKPAGVSRCPFVCPPHWSDHQQYIFGHMVRDGRSIEEAAAHIEAEIRDMEDAKAQPFERDRLLFLARRALSRMRKIGD